MLRYCLTFEEVILPVHPPVWPEPLNLTVELNEVLLIEGVGREEAEPFIRVAATLQAPEAGQVKQWGQPLVRLPREELDRLRRRIACISPDQVLLHRFTLGGNIALGPRYHLRLSGSAVFQRHADLLHRLELTPHLRRLPSQVDESLYFRTLWARELVKDPSLILAALTGNLRQAVGDSRLYPLLTNYLDRRGGALVILGDSLEPFYPLAHRLLRLESGKLRAEVFPGRRPRPLTAFLPLV